MKDSKSQSQEIYREVNFDGLVGLTHNYAGLAQGNIASSRNKNKVSNPKKAALQGLEKMLFLLKRGITQAILPPQLRPDLLSLRRLGFEGRDSEILDRVGKSHPTLLAASWSASAMWTANAATFSPSLDSSDGKSHFTPANLSSQWHRSIETRQTKNILTQIFPASEFVHHEPLPSSSLYADEGAANHSRIAPFHSAPGIQLFVYGYNQGNPQTAKTQKHIPRQAYEASEAISRLHRLNSHQILFAQQNPKAIDAGVFHNDVISVANENFFFLHELAFKNQPQVLKSLREKYRTLVTALRSNNHFSIDSMRNLNLKILEVPQKEVSLSSAISSYLFNSQVISLPAGGMLFLAAQECQENPQTKKYLKRLLEENTDIAEIAFMDLKQSMRNGGGPACLRLRVLLNSTEWKSVPETVKFTENLYLKLRDWVKRHYRDRLLPSDLRDGELLKESIAATQDLARLLQLKWS